MSNVIEFCSGRKRIKFHLFTIIALAVGLLVVGCKSYNREQIVTYEELYSKTKLGEVVWLNSIIKESKDTVCILFPYQQTVSIVNPESGKMNTFLNKINYVADEGHWAFLFTSRDSVSISRFKRSNELDVLAPHELHTEEKRNLPSGFEPADCLPLDQAGLYKISVKGRKYIILGRVK